MEPTTLNEALARACDLLFAKAGLIMPSHILRMKDRVEGALQISGYPEAHVIITAKDERESIIVHVAANDGTEDTAERELVWQRADGTYVARVDLDGDGQ